MRGIEAQSFRECKSSFPLYIHDLQPIRQVISSYRLQLAIFFGSLENRSDTNCYDDQLLGYASDRRRRSRSPRAVTAPIRACRPSPA
jgi:hypothetical protein